MSLTSFLAAKVEGVVETGSVRLGKGAAAAKMAEEAARKRGNFILKGNFENLGWQLGGSRGALGVDACGCEGTDS